MSLERSNHPIFEATNCDLPTAIGSYLSLHELASYAEVNSNTHKAVLRLFRCENDRFTKEATMKFKDEECRLFVKSAAVVGSNFLSYIPLNNNTNALEEKEPPIRGFSKTREDWLCFGTLFSGLSGLCSVLAATNQTLRIPFIFLAAITGVSGIGLCTLAVYSTYYLKKANSSLIKQLGVFSVLNNPTQRALSNPLLLSEIKEDKQVTIVIDKESRHSNDDNEETRHLLSKK